MNTVIIQPPLVQLNTPYPAGAYLASFFRTTNITGDAQHVYWLDLSTGLFRELFCSQGLAKLFDLSRTRALALADKAEKNGDDTSAFQLR